MTNRIVILRGEGNINLATENEQDAWEAAEWISRRIGFVVQTQMLVDNVWTPVYTYIRGEIHQ